MWIKRLFRFGKVAPAQNEDEARDLSGSFCEHTWDLHRIAKAFDSSKIDTRDVSKSQGLSPEEAIRLVGIHGENALPKPKEISDLMLFLKQFCSLLWLMLLVASVLSFIQWVVDIDNEMPSLYVSIILAVMIVVMCTLSFYQERKARKTVATFSSLLPEVCTVIRNGKEESVPANTLVNGDVIVIRSGNRVPADARILKCTEFKLESSSITGEAEPIEYSSEAVEENVTVFDAKNVAFNGSMCVDGFAHAVVIRIGPNTVIGQIANMTTGQEDKGSTLQREITRFVKILALMAVFIGIVCFIVGGFVHKWDDIVSLITNGFLVAAIGMVPCGLAATVTSMLTLVARRMASKNVCLKRLDIVEALGSANIIASDKTGTLTKNIMTVTDLWYCDKKISGAPPRNQTGSGVKAFELVYERLLTVMTFCNVAEFLDKSERKDEKGAHTNPGFTNTESSLHLDNAIRRPASGSPSEIAMINFVDPLFSIDGLRAEHKMVFEIPFNSKRKWHLRICHERDLPSGKSEYRLMLKGAPEILIKMCGSIYTDDGVQELNAERLAMFQSNYDNFGSEGKRVIGFVEKVFVADDNMPFKLDDGNFPMEGLTFCGMCAIMDPPKDETAGAIRACKEAGIKVFMVTGDHPSTAAAIAKQIDLLGPEAPSSCVIHGEQIPKLTSLDWDSVLLNDYLVFARTTPEQKLLIVEQCQKRGHTIVMTGDGVNDSPALKKATVGIAMGSGSEVAKQAADVILMDDNFASIVKAIEQGRLMFDNLKKLMGYTMPHCFPQLWPVLMYYILGMPQGLTSLQILSIDLGTELLPGVSMSSEPIESNIMKRPPRRNEVKLVSNTLLAYAYLIIGQFQSITCVLCYFYVFWHHDINVGDLFYSQDSWTEDGEIFESGGEYFNWPTQEKILRQVRAGWYIGLVVGQFFHIFNARTRKESIFKHGIFRNRLAILGVIVEMGLLCLFVYCPGLNHWLGAEAPPGAVWGIASAGGVFVFVFNEIRKFFIRRYPKNRFVRLFKW